MKSTLKSVGRTAGKVTIYVAAYFAAVNLIEFIEKKCNERRCC